MGSVKKKSDPELIGLLKKGNVAAFTEIYDRHWEKTAECAYKLCRSETHTQNILSAVFVSLWQNRESLTPDIVLADFLIKDTICRSLLIIKLKLQNTALEGQKVIL